MSATPDSDAGAPVRRSGRGLRLALVLSLAANLAFAGLIGGAILRHDRDGRPDTALADIGFGPFVMAMPPADRKALGKALVAQAGSLRANREALRANFQDLLDALRAQPFHLDAVKAAMGAAETRLQQRQEIGRALLFQRIGAMSDAERLTFADRLQEGMRRGPPPRHFHDEGKPRPDDRDGPPGPPPPPPPSE